jgi:adenylate cyclase
MTRTEEMILDREIRGIRFLLITKMVFVVIAAVSLTVTTQNFREFVITTIILAAGFLIMVFLLHLLRRRSRVRLVGLLSVLLDLVVLMPLPMVWYNAVGGDVIPRTYLLKTYLPVMIYIVMILEAVALQPLYPIVFSVGSSLVLGLYYFHAAADPRFSGTGDFVRAFLGDSVHTNMYVTNIFITVAAGVTLFVITRIARRTVYEATRYEVSTSQLSRYFSPKIAEAISVAGEDFMKPQGVLQDAAVLFCDIRDFTSLSERLEPGEIMKLLSEYHEKMVGVIFKHEGTLDKFIGDGILAVFGTPAPRDDDAVRAVKAALDMRSALEDLNRERRGRGLFEIRIGIGVHYGRLLAGNIGVANRLEFTVIGDTVNLASRIEGLCKTTGRDLLVSRAVADCLGSGFSLTSLGTHEVKGKAQSVEVFTLA